MFFCSKTLSNPIFSQKHVYAPVPTSHGQVIVAWLAVGQEYHRIKELFVLKFDLNIRGLFDMLQLRPNCECCNRDLPPGGTEARICSFECTFCDDCAQQKLGGVCPNCGGELVVRPRRPEAKLLNNPASTERVFKPAGCSPA